MKLQELIGEIQAYHPNPDLELVRKAYSFAKLHHQGQTRSSGEPYITHVTEVAYLAAKLRLDVASIVTALLHDTVEDTGVTLTDIQREFGKETADLVDGVTKLNQIQFSSRAEQQAENFRKMLLAMARDIRVLLVKLCDRVHNMRTLEFLSESRRTRIAQETLDIYAPLAHRLGIYWLKSELEDLSFQFLKPQMYEFLKQQVNQSRKERERYTTEVVDLLRSELTKHSIVGDISGRPKHFYSIYQKMESHSLTFSDIHDLIAFRIIVPTTMDCYAVLGVIHAAWKPIPGRFKDYIAMPKANNYQSLHTTVIGPSGNRMEIQIRTPDMHDVAEKGIAAHWKYKEKDNSEKQDEFQFAWLKDLVESERLVRDPYEFLSAVKEDLFPQEVFVFTPKGDLVSLSKGATPIDFAYHIHSDIGHRCTGARVNGQQVPLAHRLRNGDTVEIVTSENQKPSKDWLQFVSTTKAKQRIRSWIKNEERVRSISIGKELLTKDLRKVKKNLQKIIKDGELKRVANEFGHRDEDLLLAEIGYGKISSHQVLTKLFPEEQNLEEKLTKPDTPLQKIFQRAARAFRERAGITVHGMDDVVFHFAKCCEPLPGDELVGYISHGRGVVVHTRGCQQTHSFDPRRIVPVRWDSTVKTLRPIALTVTAIDSLGLLTKLAQCISGQGANITKADLATTTDGKSITTFELKVESSAQLENITRALEGVSGVLTIERRRR